MTRHPFLTVVGAEAVTLLLIVAGWNAWSYRADLRKWLRM